MKPDAQQAITILNEVQTACGSAMLAYWALPNVILTLSGARAYCDGIFWSSDKTQLAAWDKDITVSLEVIKSHSSLLAASTGVQSVRDGETYASYDLLFKDGLATVEKQTSLLDLSLVDVSNPEITTEAIIGQMVELLRKSQEFKDYNDENLGHVAFGILVGYPDKAIIESVKLRAVDDPFAEPHVSADIRGAGYYSCPQPVYSYPRHLVTDNAIKAHEQAWSQILQDYYQSDFHKTLEANALFQKKMEELNNLR